MANNRQVPRLDKLAFEAFLRYRKEYNKNEYEGEFQCNPVIMRHMKDDIPLFLQCIADADLVGTEKLLKKNPLLAVLASGTVTTVSGCTYENVSAIQLAYLMDDVEMCNMMLPYIKDLSEDMIQKAGDDLAKKMAEVEKQRAEFKVYDFSEIVKAITEEQLKNTRQPSPATEKMLATFKEYFKAGIIKEGKSWIKEHLQEGFRIYYQNWGSPWNGNQLRWYLINVIGHMETLAEKCFEYECSQGLKEIVDKKKLLRRSNTIINYINNLPLTLTYRGSVDATLLLGQDFFVDVHSGAVGRSAEGRRAGGLLQAAASLKSYVEQKDQGWKNLSSSLTSNNHHSNSEYNGNRDKLAAKLIGF